MQPTQIKQALRKYRGDILICLFLCAFSLLSRWTTLEPVELSGDPLDY